MTAKQKAVLDVSSARCYVSTQSLKIQVSKLSTARKALSPYQMLYLKMLASMYQPQRNRLALA